jgi:hypothetical protein
MRSIQLLAGEMVPKTPTWFSCRVRRSHAYSRSRPGGVASGQADDSEIIYGLAKSFMSSLVSLCSARLTLKSTPTESLAYRGADTWAKGKWRHSGPHRPATEDAHWLPARPIL